MGRAAKVTMGIMAILLIISLCVIASADWLPRYRRQVMVVEIFGSRVTCRENNREWQFYDPARDYGKYEFIYLDMDDNCTKYDITDDYIIRANGHEVQRMQCYMG